METLAINLTDCYCKEFDAIVLEVNENKVILDKTCFYATSGGQPNDIGFLIKDSEKYEVIDVKKEDNEIVHVLKENKLKVNDKIHGIINWNLRYKHMRMHIAQHLLSSLVLDEYDAETVGNQIGAETSRIDFEPFRPAQEILDSLTIKFNEIVDKKVPVKITFMTREDVLIQIDAKRRNLFSRLPESIKEIRVIEIEGIDKCPCGGTHVKNTSEIGYIKILSTQNKGKGKTRLVFKLK